MLWRRVFPGLHGQKVPRIEDSVQGTTRRYCRPIKLSNPMRFLVLIEFQAPEQADAVARLL